MWIPQDRVDAPLYVITAIFNPARWKRRWKLYRDFAAHVRQSGAILLTIEATFGDRNYSLEDHAPASPHKNVGMAPVPSDSCWMPHERLSQDYIKVRTTNELWLKENLYNRAVQHLPESAEYIAFVDADILFTRPDIVSETKHRLQHAPVVQMWSEAIDLNNDYEMLARHKSFVWSYKHNIPIPQSQFEYYYVPKEKSIDKTNQWHPGFCFAFRKSVLTQLGGLIDWGILGSSDKHMWTALIGMVEKSVHPQMHGNYKKLLLQWQEKALEIVNYNIDYVPGLICHFWHGRKVNRKYFDRWKILVENQFDPIEDLSRDFQGIYQLTNKKPKLRDDLRNYFRERIEDEITCTKEDYTM